MKKIFEKMHDNEAIKQLKQIKFSGNKSNEIIFFFF